MSDAAPIRYNSPKHWLVVAAFIVAVVAVGALIGTRSVPGSWYQSLEKPAFNPPDWLFGPVWFVLYVLIALAGARVFLRNRRSRAMGLWLVQMMLNWSWSPVWFSLHLIWPAFAIIVLLLASIIAFVVAAWRLDRISACLFLPYLTWVGFAAVLNFSIGLLN